MQDDSLMPLKALSAHIIPTENSTILKRGCAEIWFRGSHYAARLTELLKMFGQGSTEEEILACFEEKQRSEIRELVALLKAKNILVPLDDSKAIKGAPEEPLDIFYWHFDPRRGAVHDRLRSRRIVLLGANDVSRDLSRALALSGFSHASIVEYPSDHSIHRNASRQTESGSSLNGQRPIPYEAWIQNVDWKTLDCLVATSNCGGRDLLRAWNELAIRHECHFLPVVLQNGVGYIGPLVIPGETACYECLVARENSHFDDWTIRRKIEQTANESESVVGYHPLMLSALGAIAAFELVKFYGEMIADRNVGTLIEVDLLNTQITRRKVLRIPRCVVCSSLLEQPSVSIHKPIAEPEAAGA